MIAAGAGLFGIFEQNGVDLVEVNAVTMKGVEAVGEKGTLVDALAEIGPEYQNRGNFMFADATFGVVAVAQVLDVDARGAAQVLVNFFRPGCAGAEAAALIQVYHIDAKLFVGVLLTEIFAEHETPKQDEYQRHPQEDDHRHPVAQ